MSLSEDSLRKVKIRFDLMISLAFYIGVLMAFSISSIFSDVFFQRFQGEKTGAVEDEFERFCRAAVNEARQRCGGRRLVAALKPLLVDLVKRRCIESGLNPD